MKSLTKKILTVGLLLFFVFTTPSTADIKSFNIRNDDRGLIKIDEFEFTHTGHVSVSISDVSVTSRPVTSILSQPDPSRIGFFLVSDDAIAYMFDDHISCDLDSKFISLIFTFQNLSRSSFNKSYAMTSPTLYSLRFANCNPLSHVTMNIRTELYNTHDGTTKDYLSAGQTNLPSLYFKFSLVYLCSLGLWIFICFKNRSYFHTIHLLMGVLLLMKGFNLLFAAKVLYSIKITGIPMHGWNAMFYAFQCIRTVYFYTVIAVIIDGCCLLNPVFPVTYGLMIVIPIQIFVTIGSKLRREALLEDTVNWDFGLSFASCFIGVFLGIIGAAVCKTSSETVKDHLAKLINQIQLFYTVFIVYTLVDIICEVMGWAMATEIASLVFYMMMFLVFRPSEKNDFFAPLNLQEPGAPVRAMELTCA